MRQRSLAHPTPSDSGLMEEIRGKLLYPKKLVRGDSETHGSSVYLHSEVKKGLGACPFSLGGMSHETRPTKEGIYPVGGSSAVFGCCNGSRIRRRYQEVI